MRNLALLLFLVQLWAVSRSQRVGLAIGNVTFSGTNKTSINDSTTITVPHVYQARTALSLISLYRSDTTQPFAGFLASVTVAEGTSMDTLTISISASTLINITMSYEIGIQYLRVSNFSTFEILSKNATYNAPANSTNVTSDNKLMYTDGGQIDANLFIRGFTNIATLSTATIVKTNSTINYGVTIATPVANVSLTFDMLIANSTALFVDACTTSKLFKNALITNNTWTITKKTNSKYVFGVQPLSNTTNYRTDPMANTVFCNNSCSAFVLEIDSACLNTFVPVNNLQQLRGWQLPVIVVCGLLVMGVSTYLIYYLYVLNKREELAAGIFQEREHH